ncbi:MAG: TetR/AcrR family transcriptional regulator [Sciscionella sp.]
MLTPEDPNSRPHRTQAERSEHTKALLLDATIDCLVDLGYARTSVNEICKRAGVSRGAQQHHFATKAELMAEAVRHLVHRIEAQLSDTIGDPPAREQLVSTGIDLLWQSYSGTLSAAVLELWVAARTEPELKAAMLPVDRALGRSTLALYRKLAPSDSTETRTETLFWLTVNLTRGLALDAEIGGDSQRHRHLLDEWKRIVVQQYGSAIPLSGTATNG